MKTIKLGWQKSLNNWVLAVLMASTHSITTKADVSSSHGMLISQRKMWSQTVLFRTNLIQRGDDILTPALGQGIKNGLKSFVRGCQCPPRCRVLSREQEVCSDTGVPPNYLPSSSAPACPCLLQITPEQAQLLVGLMLWSWAWTEHEPTKQKMHPMQFANPRQATKALSKWGGTTTRQGNTSPTPWLLWGQSHYPKREDDYKSVHSSKNMSIFTLQPSIKHKRPLVLFTAEITHTSSEGIWTPLWGLRTVV